MRDYLSKIDGCNNLFFDSWQYVSPIVQSQIEKLKEIEKVEKLEKGEIYHKYKISDTDLMTGEQFEHFVAELFASMGYKTQVTQLSNDQGVDVIAEKGIEKIAIQAKCYSKPVGNRAVQEVTAGGRHYHATKFMVVTNNSFTREAVQLAKSNNVILWDRNVLKEKLENL